MSNSTTTQEGSMAGAVPTETVFVGRRGSIEVLAEGTVERECAEKGERIYRPHELDELLDEIGHANSFDPDVAEQVGREGMDKALRAERVQAWKEDAERWLAAQQYGTEFVADDLVRVVGLPDVGPGRNNVVGAWINGKSRTGRIVFAGRHRKSERVVRHGNEQRVWYVALAREGSTLDV
jgi:hypothetical protein